MQVIFFPFHDLPPYDVPKCQVISLEPINSCKFLEMFLKKELCGSQITVELLHFQLDHSNLPIMLAYSKYHMT